MSTYALLRRMFVWSLPVVAGCVWSETVGAATVPTPVTSAAALTPGDLIVYQVGTNGSSTSVSSAASQVYLDEYTPTGTLVQQIQVNSTSPGQPGSLTAGTQYALTASGTQFTDGKLTLSADDSTVVFTGYNAAIGTSSVYQTASTTVSRTVGLLSVLGGTPDTSTSFTNVSGGSNFRSAASPDGNVIYTAGSGSSASGGRSGTFYATKGSTTATLLTGDKDNSVAIYNNTLYVTDTASTNGIYQLGTAGTLPTTSSQVTSPSSSTTPPAVAIDDNQGTTSNPSTFVFATSAADKAPNGGPDTIYVADTAYGQIQKYQYNPTTDSSGGQGAQSVQYTLVGSVTVASSTNGLVLTGLTGGTQTLANGKTEEVLYASLSSSGTGSNSILPELLELPDTNASASNAIDGTPSSITLQDATIKTSFLGVVEIPTASPEPASLTLVGLAAGPLLVARRRRRAGPAKI